MSLYPSLEDMKYDEMLKAQQTAPNAPTTALSKIEESSHSPSAPPTSITDLYPALNTYMGLEFTDAVLEANMPEYLPGRQMLSAPISGREMGLKRAQVTHGIRQVVLCKDGTDRVGLRVKCLDTGVFICLVVAKSPAAMVGFRFGDQILSINQQLVAGWSMDKVHGMFRNSPPNGIEVVVRDRPFERTVTMHKDSVGTLGFQFKAGKVISIVKDSSAARNGLLTDHQLLEVDGQNVVSIKDKEILGIIEAAGQIVTVTIIPYFIYQRMIDKMSGGFLKSLMDHSIPDL